MRDSTREKSLACPAATLYVTMMAALVSLTFFEKAATAVFTCGISSELYVIEPPWMQNVVNRPD